MPNRARLSIDSIHDELQRVGTKLDCEVEWVSEHRAWRATGDVGYWFHETRAGAVMGYFMLALGFAPIEIKFAVDT